MQKGFFFKLHWLLGAIFGLLLFIVGISGALLSYKSELMQMLNAQTYNITIPQNTQRLTNSEILKIYQDAHKDAKINSITFSSKDTSSVVLNVA